MAGALVPPANRLVRDWSADMNEATWRRLFDLIRDGFVVPVVGSRLLVGADGSTSLQAQVAQRLLADYDLDNAQPLPPFRELNEAVTRLLQMGNGGPRLQDLYADVHRAIDDVTAADTFTIPAPIRQLAEIADFRLFVTLTPDGLLARSLRQRCGVNEIIQSPMLPSTEKSDLPDDWAKRPGEVYLLYLFGKSRPAPVFAIHDEDVLEYAHNVIARENYVPAQFINELRQRYLLLIGCNFPEWLSRFFLRATSASRLLERREWLIEELRPDESLTCFLNIYSKDTHILSEIPPVEFVAELHRRWSTEHGGSTPSATVPATEVVPHGTMFFISYSRKTDLPQAEHIYQALLGLGVATGEVWFDRKTIEPGQDFSDEILAGIRSCRYFLPLLSEATNAREEAFVFKEWQEANDRKMSMNREFVFPIVVEKEFTPERYTAKPILDGNWARLDFCHAPEGVPDQRMTDTLTRLVRDARRPSRGD